ncbi:MAG: SDR family oxidoreductase [Chloroflexota bacterium]|nr:MAG: short-chain dehydrogenase [Chloroflexota bacterium]
MPTRSAQTRVALITGSSRGLGAVIAQNLAGQGYDLVLTARGRQALEASTEALAKYGVRIEALAGDINDPEHRRQLAAAARSLGSLDILINNASDIGPSPLPPLAEYPLDALARVFATNVIAQLGLVQAALPLLRQSRGLIVNITSDAARGGYPGWGGYGASKAALELVSLTLANELREDGVAVVTVDPGDMRTEMHQLGYPGEDISDRPLPDVTIPFWSWLFEQDWQAISGQRFEAQADRWEVRHEAR